MSEFFLTTFQIAFVVFKSLSFTVGTLCRFFIIDILLFLNHGFMSFFQYCRLYPNDAVFLECINYFQVFETSAFVCRLSYIMAPLLD